MKPIIHEILDGEMNIAPKPQSEKKNKDFIQFYTKNMDYIIQLIDKSPTAAKIFMLLCKYCERNNTVYLSTKDIMSMLNIKRKETVYNNIKILKEDGYIVTYPYGKVKFYMINPEMAANCAPQYKKKLYETYGSKVSREESCNHLTDIDKNIINTDTYDRDDKLRLTVGFYKSHPELQAPTEEELQQQQENEAYLDDMLAIKNGKVYLPDDDEDNEETYPLDEEETYPLDEEETYPLDEEEIYQKETSDFLADLEKNPKYKEFLASNEWLNAPTDPSEYEDIE